MSSQNDSNGQSLSTAMVSSPERVTRRLCGSTRTTSGRPCRHLVPPGHRYCYDHAQGELPAQLVTRPGSWAESIQLSHRKGRKRWNGGGSGNVFQHPVVANCSGHRFDRVHTAQKPISLMLELVELFSDPGEVVFDPFAGSGTTGVAALRLGRRFIGIELDETCAELARERCAAEVEQSTLEARRAGQVPLWGDA